MEKEYIIFLNFFLFFYFLTFVFIFNLKCTFHLHAFFYNKINKFMEVYSLPCLKKKKKIQVYELQFLVILTIINGYPFLRKFNVFFNFSIIFYIYFFL